MEFVGGRWQQLGPDSAACGRSSQLSSTADSLHHHQHWQLGQCAAGPFPAEQNTGAYTSACQPAAGSGDSHSQEACPSYSSNCHALQRHSKPVAAQLRAAYPESAEGFRQWDSAPAAEGVDAGRAVTGLHLRSTAAAEGSQWEPALLTGPEPAAAAEPLAAARTGRVARTLSMLSIIPDDILTLPGSASLLPTRSASPPKQLRRTRSSAAAESTARSEELRSSAVRRMMAAITTRPLSAEDLNVVTSVVQRVVEFVAFRAAADAIPDAIADMKAQQMHIWRHSAQDAGGASTAGPAANSSTTSRSTNGKSPTLRWHSQPALYSTAQQANGLSDMPPTHARLSLTGEGRLAQPGRSASQNGRRASDSGTKSSSQRLSRRSSRDPGPRKADEKGAADCQAPSLYQRVEEACAFDEALRRMSQGSSGSGVSNKQLQGATGGRADAGICEAVPKTPAAARRKSRLLPVSRPASCCDQAAVSNNTGRVSPGLVVPETGKRQPVGASKQPGNTPASTAGTADAAWMGGTAPASGLVSSHQQRPPALPFPADCCLAKPSPREALASREYYPQPSALVSGTGPYSAGLQRRVMELSRRQHDTIKWEQKHMREKKLGTTGGILKAVVASNW